MSMWNPWRGCKKCSDGCLHCYIHKGDLKRNVNTNNIVKTKDFLKPIERLKNGNYKMKSKYSYKEIENILSENGLLIYEHLDGKELTDTYFLKYNTLNLQNKIVAPKGVCYCLAVKR